MRDSHDDDIDLAIASDMSAVTVTALYVRQQKNVLLLCNHSYKVAAPMTAMANDITNIYLVWK